MAKAEGVSKSYGDKLVLRGVNLEVERGDRVAFVGQNGQGKSTRKSLTERNHRRRDHGTGS